MSAHELADPETQARIRAIAEEVCRRGHFFFLDGATPFTPLYLNMLADAIVGQKIYPARRAYDCGHRQLQIRRPHSRTFAEVWTDVNPASSFSYNTSPCILHFLFSEATPLSMATSWRQKITGWKPPLKMSLRRKLLCRARPRRLRLPGQIPRAPLRRPRRPPLVLLGGLPAN